MRRLTALLRIRPGRLAAAVLGTGALVVTAGLSAAAPAGASTAAPVAVSAHSARAAVTSLGVAAIPVAGINVIRPASYDTPQVPLIGEFYLVLKSDHSLRIASEGVGVDAQWVTSGYSSFNQATCAGGSFAWVNQNGAYLRAKNAGDVQMSNTCDANAQWTLVGNPITFQNVGLGTKLSANSDAPGGVKVGASWLATDLAT